VDLYLDKKDRVWVIDVNPFGEPTCPLLFEWSEFADVSDLEVKIVENENEKLSSAKGMNRGPIDVHMAPNFQNFLNICKEQSQEPESDDDDEN